VNLGGQKKGRNKQRGGGGNKEEIKKQIKGSESRTSGGVAKPERQKCHGQGGEGI